MGLPSPQEMQYRHAVLLIVALGAFMVSVDTTIVNINLPSIASSFGADLTQISWVVIIYLTVLACCLPAMGRLGDIYGFRLVFAIACGIFTVSSLLCGFSPSAIHLIFFRALQGIGAAGLYAIGPAILMQYIPEEKHGWALGIMTTMVSVGIAVGPILGGFIAEYASWNWIFFVNVPVGISMIAATLKYLPHDTGTKTALSFDLLGALLIFLALITLLFPLNRGLYLGWDSPIIAGSFCLSLLFWVMFIIRELSCRDPLIYLRIFGNWAFLLGNIIAFIMTFVISGARFLFPYFFENVRGFSPVVTGLLLAIPAVTLIITGLVAGTLSDRYGSWGLIGISLILTVVIFVMFGVFGPETALPFIIIAFALEGIATGLYSSPNMNQILSAGGYHEKGMSSSVMMTIRNIASAMGVAIFGSVVLNKVVSEGIVTGIPLQWVSSTIPGTGFQTAFHLGAILSLCALVLVVIIIVQKWSADEVLYEPRAEIEQKNPTEYYLYVYP